MTAGESPDDGFIARTRADLRRAGRVLLMDLEFTCWEDSLRTDWADPARPREIIEVGLAVYRVDTQAVTATFKAFARPRLNPVLSDYCVRLLHIPQHEIDAAPEVPGVFDDVTRWLRAVSADGLLTCAWGPLDRSGIAENARRHGVADPFATHPHLDLCTVMTALQQRTTPISRDELRTLAQLPPNPGRHRALDDALDLTHFLALFLSAR